MRCSVSINPSLQRALRSRFVLGVCQADIYVPTSPAYICTRSLAVLFSITSIPASAPLSSTREIRLSHLRLFDFFSTLCRTCGIIFAIIGHSSRILLTANQSDCWNPHKNNVRDISLHSNHCTILKFSCSFLSTLYCEFITNFLLIVFSLDRSLV